MLMLGRLSHKLQLANIVGKYKMLFINPYKIQITVQ